MGDCFGEVAFFTEIPQMQTVRTVTVCRVLVVPRTAYQVIKSAFPLGTRQMLDNLQAHAELVGHSQFLNEALTLGCRLRAPVMFAGKRELFLFFSMR